MGSAELKTPDAREEPGRDVGCEVGAEMECCMGERNEGPSEGGKSNVL
jgi:hypothetical protein